MTPLPIVTVVTMIDPDLDDPERIQVEIDSGGATPYQVAHMLLQTAAKVLRGDFIEEEAVDG